MFFIFGSPRSGTTLLAQCLNNHTDIIVPDETDFIIPWAFVFDRIRDSEIGKDLLLKLITHSTAFQKSIGEYLPKERLAKIINDSAYQPAQMLDAVYAELAKAAGKKIAGDKSPNDLLFLRMLVKVGGIEGPHMKLVHIVRDIRDVMVSLNRVRWVDDLDLYFPRFWSNSNLYLHSLYRKKTSEYLLVRYEDMVCDPERTFRGICRFLRVDFQEEMLDFRRFSARYQGEPAHAKLYTPISAGHIGAYRRELGRETVRAYERQAREGLQRFGYLGTDRACRRWFKAVALAFRRPPRSPPPAGLDSL